MRHEDIRDHLSEYVEGTLDPAMRDAMERHLSACEDCAREAATLRQVFGWLEMPALQVEPPGAFHDNVMRRVRLLQRERERTPRGFLARLGWGWTAAGATALAAVLLAIVVAVGPLHEGLSAGFGLGHPRANAPAVMPAAPGPRVGPILTFSAGQGPFDAGRALPLRVSFQASTGGLWRVLVAPSSGLSLLTPGRADGTRGLEVWRGRLEAGQAVGPTLDVQPAAAGAVEMLLVRVESGDGASVTEDAVFLPVQTGGRPEGLEDWQSRSNDTLRATAADMARAYGRPVAVPADALDRPVSLALRGASGAAAMQAIAGSAGLRCADTGGVYQMYP